MPKPNQEPRRPSFYARGLLACAAGLLLLPAAAQTPAAKPLSEMTPAERAQRDADKVFQWILKADRIQPSKPAAAPAAAPVAAAARKAPSNGAASSRPAAPTAPSPEATPVLAEAGAVEPPTQVALAAPSVAAPRPEPAAAPAPAAPEPELPLKLLVKVEPVLPRQLMASLDSATVQVRFSVQPDGSVQQVEALHSSNRRLTPAVLAAVSQWRFEPIPRARDASVELAFGKD
ncbi:TonB family protein [Roseateles violae]|uniref:TonB family protein n=1 Tax=Roseateles violae TaxID=3058042 RepID=A0ABT8DWX3_9BURK|nr:TonB family protein [Pelomonas sp. PFR6]MDN3922623.1 TonB family protein [Pelomonas sp. PFR6]